MLAIVSPGNLGPEYFRGGAHRTRCYFPQTGITFVEYLIGIIGFSFVMSWVFNNTGGSVLMAILLHAAFDAAGAFEVLFPSTYTGISPISLTLGIAIVSSIAALVIIIATRGQLSYQREVELPATSGTVR